MLRGWWWIEIDSWVGNMILNLGESPLWDVSCPHRGKVVLGCQGSAGAPFPPIGATVLAPVLGFVGALSRCGYTLETIIPR